jgi:drug/metabolite transporter (DMT)-like permease
MVRASAPLLVAALAACAAGLGNVAFSLHDGSQLALAGVRFAAGFILCVAWLRVRRVPHVAGGPAGVLAAAAGAASPLLLMFSASYASTGVFTLIGSLSPVLVAVGGRAVGARRASGSQGALAAVAVGLSLAAVLLGGQAAGGTYAVGVLLAVAASVALAVSLLAASTLERVHPARILRDICCAGIVLCVLLALFGVEVRVTGRSVLASVFIAAVPGGVAKAALLWAASRTAPHLVAATMSFAVVPAAVGAALLLGQGVTVSAAAAGLGATVAVALLVSRPDTGAPPPPHRAAVI